MDKYIPRSVGTILLYGWKDITTAGTAVILTTATESVWLHIRAHATNSAKIYVGDSDVTTGNGFILTTTNPDVKMRFDHNSENIYINGTKSDGVSFIGWR